MVGRKIDTELQIQEPEVLAAATPARRADAVQNLGPAARCAVDDLSYRLAAFHIAQRLGDQRVPGQDFVELLEDRLRLRAVIA